MMHINSKSAYAGDADVWKLSVVVRLEAFWLIVQIKSDAAAAS